jgi:hypothetical protein
MQKKLIQKIYFARDRNSKHLLKEKFFLLKNLVESQVQMKAPLLPRLKSGSVEQKQVMWHHAKNKLIFGIKF